jgi:cytoskeletal protein CcmA (bactofilin family)
VSKIHDDLRQAERERLAGPSKIGAGLKIKGEISGNEDIFIDGEVEGPLQLGSGRLTLESNGNVAGNVTSREAVIHGTLKGNLKVRDRIEIKTHGSVIGDVVTDRIHIEDGAHFKGAIEIGNDNSVDASRLSSGAAAGLAAKK